MTKRAHIATWTLLCLVSLLLGPLLTAGASPSAWDQQVSAAQGVFGVRVTQWMQSRANALDVGTGPFSAPPRPASAAERKHLSVVSSLVVDRAERYAQALRLQWIRTVFKALVMFAWVLLLAPIAVAATADGLARRAVKVADLGYQNPAAFALASHAVIASVMLPCAVLVAPFDVSPWFMLVWGLLALVPLNVALGHLQPVFTR